MKIKSLLIVLLITAVAVAGQMEGLNLIDKEKQRLEEGNREVIKKAKEFMEIVSGTGEPMITMKEGNKKVVLRINEYGYPETRVFEGKPVVQPETIETGTNIKEVENKVVLVKFVVQMVAGVLWLFSFVYFLVHAYRSFRDGEYVAGAIDLIVLVITTGLMGRLLGML